MDLVHGAQSLRLIHLLLQQSGDVERLERLESLVGANKELLGVELTRQEGAAGLKLDCDANKEISFALGQLKKRSVAKLRYINRLVEAGEALSQEEVGNSGKAHEEVQVEREAEREVEREIEVVQREIQAAQAARTTEAAQVAQTTAAQTTAAQTTAAQTTAAQTTASQPTAAQTTASQSTAAQETQANSKLHTNQITAPTPVPVQLDILPTVPYPGPVKPSGSDASHAPITKDTQGQVSVEAALKVAHTGLPQLVATQPQRTPKRSQGNVRSSSKTELTPAVTRKASRSRRRSSVAANKSARHSASTNPESQNGPEETPLSEASISVGPEKKVPELQETLHYQKKRELEPQGTRQDEPSLKIPKRRQRGRQNEPRRSPKNNHHSEHQEESMEEPQNKVLRESQQDLTPKSMAVSPTPDSDATSNGPGRRRVSSRLRKQAAPPVPAEEQSWPGSPQSEAEESSTPAESPPKVATPERPKRQLSDRSAKNTTPKRGSKQKREYEWCTCKTDKNEDMIECEKNGCPIGWYHKSCSGLKGKLSSHRYWMCDLCLNDNGLTLEEYQEMQVKAADDKALKQRQRNRKRALQRTAREAKRARQEETRRERETAAKENEATENAAEDHEVEEQAAEEQQVKKKLTRRASLASREKPSPSRRVSSKRSTRKKISSPYNQWDDSDEFERSIAPE